MSEQDGSLLAEAIRTWIRAEYQFRLGPEAYSARAQTWLVEAEGRLREVLTGSAGLHLAFRQIGEGTRFTERRRLLPSAHRPRLKSRL